MFAPTRRTDPDTSRIAAERHTPERLSALHRAVLFLLREYGPMTHDRLIQRVGSVTVSPQSIRSRCAELVKAGLVKDTGQRVTVAGRRRFIVWSLNTNQEE